MRILQERVESQPPPSDDDNKKPKPTSISYDHSSQAPSESTQQAFVVSGNYDPRDGVLFKALNLIENEIFYRDPLPPSKHGIVQNALVYLNYGVYE